VRLLVKYRDEKYVEALEAEVEALRRRLRLTTGSVQGRALAKGGDLRGSSAVAAEELYRRARTEVAAEAGAGYGRVSLEALYLLPTEFTNAYQRLFLRALKESPGQASGEANTLVKKRAKKGQIRVVKDSATGESREVELALDRDPDRGGGKARAGKRHRDHWLIKDEVAFRLKSSVDRELRELADLISRAAGTAGPTNQAKDNVTPQCAGCQRFLKVTWHYCPGCGTKIGQGS
jgi:hypothetical protein